MKHTLTPDQCRAMLSRMKEADRALFLSLLLCGRQARKWTWEQMLDQVLDLPAAVYYALRALAVKKKIALIPTNSREYSVAHWVSGTALPSPIFCAANRETAYTTHECTRRFKRYARQVGLDPRAVTLRTVLNTRHVLISAFDSMDEAADVLGLSPTSPAAGLRAQARNGDQPTWKSLLHGIGRRSSGSRRLSSR